MDCDRFAMSFLDSYRLRPETIDLTGTSSREASLRRSFPNANKMASQHSKRRSSRKSKSKERDANATHQVRISLRSLDDAMDREILLTPERTSFEFSRASGRVDQNMKPSPSNGWITSPIVSRSHCRVYVDLPGQAVWIKDLSSTHGTFLNTRRLQNGCSHRVSHGDRIRLGVPVVNGAATYQPKSFEVKFQWETRPIITSSIPTPADSPEQLASKTFSVPNGSDSDEDSVIIAGEVKKVLTTPTKSTQNRGDASNYVAANPSTSIQIQVPGKMAGMSQIPVVTFSDSEDEVPESIPIVKVSSLHNAKVAPQPHPTSKEPSPLSKAPKSTTLAVPEHRMLSDRLSPDYSPTFDNQLLSAQTGVSQQSSQPEEIGPEKAKMSTATDEWDEYEDLYGIASEDDWLPDGNDECSLSGDPSHPYGDDAEEFYEELQDYPSFRPRRGSTSSASSAEEDSDDFQPGQNTSIHIPESISSESESDDDDDTDEAEDIVAHGILANEPTEPAADPSESGVDHQEGLQNTNELKEAANTIDAAAIIAMLRTQPPPDANEAITPIKPHQSRCETLRSDHSSMPASSRFVFGDNFDTSPAAFSPPPLKSHYTQGPFASSNAPQPIEAAVETSIPYFGVDNMIDFNLGSEFAAYHEPGAASQLPPSFDLQTAPEVAVDPSNKTRSTRVSIADIINGEACKSTGQKRKADDMEQETREQDIAPSFYEMDDNSLLYMSDKGVETALDNAAQRQLDDEVRAASNDPIPSGSQDSIPDAQPRDDVLLPPDTPNLIAYEKYLFSLKDQTTMLAELASADEMTKERIYRRFGAFPVKEWEALPDPELICCAPKSRSDVGEDAGASNHDDAEEPPRKKRRISPPTSAAPRSPTRGRFTWRSFVTGAVTGAVAVLGAAAAIVATVPPEVRDEVMREW